MELRGKYTQDILTIPVLGIAKDKTCIRAVRVCVEAGMLYSEFKFSVPLSHPWIFLSR